MQQTRTIKKIFLVVFSLIMVLIFTNCGKKDEGAPGNHGGKSAAAHDRGAPKGDKKDEKIDVDKLDIPDRMKKAIKSGKIPMDRVKQFMEMRKGKSGGNAPLVAVEKVARKSLNSYLVLNGAVEPEKSVKVYSRIAAFVKELKAEEGDMVSKGTPLALLDDEEIRISYEQARIQLDQAKLTLGDEEKNFTRNKELMESELISEKDYQTAVANYKKAKLDYENRIESFKNLQLQLAYTRLKSPVQGYVTERLIEVGDNLNANQHVYTVEDFSPLLVKVFVPSADVVKLQTGLTAEITSEILKGRTFKGDVKLINPRIDVQSGTVKVTVEVFDKTMKLRPGMFVEVKIIVGEKKDVLVIPRKCITYKQEKPFVYVLNRMKVDKREIKVGLVEEDQVEVLEGLDEGETIVTVGVESLKDDMHVRVAR